VKGFVGASVLCLAAASAPAAETVREIAWGHLKQRSALPAGEVRPPAEDAAFEYVEVRNAEPHARTFRLLEIDAPPITRSRYGLAGQVRHDGVEGTGYLEMWSSFADKGSFFTRSLASGGHLQDLSGSSSWRPFLLPFDARGAGAPPTRLTFNVVLPGRGRVHVGPLRLVQYADGEDPLAVSGAWWGPRTAGLVGGALGGMMGCLGALIGILAQRGKARALVLGLARLMMAFGVASLVAAIVAVFRRQPYEVVYPLFLIGTLALTVPGFALPTLRRRYEEMELRRMQAQDVG
jgi:hypothetical protein